jgi:transposase
VENAIVGIDLADK